MQRDILHDAVALVEDADDRDALRHRGNSALPCGSGGNFLGPWSRCILLLGPAPARRHSERHQQGCGSSSHAYSGIHGS